MPRNCAPCSAGSAFCCPNTPPKSRASNSAWHRRRLRWEVEWHPVPHPPPQQQRTTTRDRRRCGRCKFRNGTTKFNDRVPQPPEGGRMIRRSGALGKTYQMRHHNQGYYIYSHVIFVVIGNYSIFVNIMEYPRSIYSTSTSPPPPRQYPFTSKKTNGATGHWRSSTT